MEGAIREANDAFLLMVGYTREDLRAGLLRWTDMTPPRWQPQDEKAREQIHQSRMCTPYEKEFIRKDGSKVPILIGAARLEGSETESIVFIVDISERKRAEAKTARVASFPILNPNPIMEVDRSGVVYFTNPAIERLFPDLREKGREHPLLANGEAFVRPFYESGLMQQTRDVYVNERWYRQEMHLVEETKYIRIFGQDITDRKNAERELLERAVQFEKAGCPPA